MVQIHALFNEAFARKTMAFLETKYPEWAASQSLESRQELLIRGMKQAAKHQMQSPKEVAAFLEYLVKFGEDFEDNPKHDWARKILKVRNISGFEKISRLQKKMPI